MEKWESRALCGISKRGWESRLFDFSTPRLFHGLAGRQFRVEQHAAALVIATERMRPIAETQGSIQVLVQGDGIWQTQLGPALVGWQVLGWTVGVLTGLAAWPLTMLVEAITVVTRSDIGFLLTLILALGPISGYAACVALGILDNLRYFDVEDKELAQEFAIAYLLMRCFPFASERFSAAMHWFAAGYGGWARGFCPYLGLTGLDAASGSPAADVAA